VKETNVTQATIKQPREAEVDPILRTTE